MQTASIRRGPFTFRAFAGTLQELGSAMIETASNVGPLLNRTKWFAKEVSWIDSFRLVSYVQSAQPSSRLGFIRHTFQTKVIDLTASEDWIFGQFRKNTRYGIRRARRDGVTCHFDGDPVTFRRFYNQFARGRGLRPIPSGLIESAVAEVCLSYARLDDGVLVMHCTLADRTLRRGRLWYSCSCHTLEDSLEVRNTVGRANRLLHFEDMRYFKRQKLAIYDFGGYSADQTDRKRMAINAFKDGFGGRLVVEANYVSYPLFLAVRGRELLRRFSPPRAPGRWAGLHPEAS
jgi:hypothetical protein